MFIKGSNISLSERLKTLNIFKLTLDFTLKDFKIKLLNEFNENKFKLNLFLA
jgi:hypothetical protein